MRECPMETVPPSIPWEHRKAVLQLSTHYLSSELICHCLHQLFDSWLMLFGIAILLGKQFSFSLPFPSENYDITLPCFPVAPRVPTPHAKCSLDGNVWSSIQPRKYPWGLPISPFSQHQNAFTECFKMYKWLTFIVVFEPHNNPVRQAMMIVSIWHRGNWILVWVINLSKAPS